VTTTNTTIASELPHQLLGPPMRALSTARSRPTPRAHIPDGVTGTEIIDHGEVSPGLPECANEFEQLLTLAKAPADTIEVNNF
jgi:hypothetical protein